MNSFSVGVATAGTPVVEVASQLTMLSTGLTPLGFGGDVEVTCCPPTFLGLPLPPPPPPTPPPPPLAAAFAFLRGLSPSDSSSSSSSSSSSLVLGSARRGFLVEVEFLRRRDCRLPVPCQIKSINTYGWKLQEMLHRSLCLIYYCKT